MPPRKPVIFNAAYALPLIVLLAPFCYAAFFTFPDADDYGRAVLADHLFDVFGGVKEMLRAWMKWSGRYTHHFLIVFLGDLAESRAGYTAACLGNMLLHFIALAGISKEVSGTRHTATAAVLGLFLLVSLTATHGSLQSSWYLLTGIFSLGMASAFTLLYIWTLCVIWNRPVILLKHRFFATAFCIAAIGCYEHSAVITVIASVAAYFLAKAHNHRHVALFRRLCVVSLVCIALSFFCRGNFRRQTKRDIGGAVILGQLGDAWSDWLIHVAPRLITPLYASILAWAAWVRPRDAARANIAPSLLVLFCLAAAAAYMGALTVIHAASDVTVAEADNIPAHMSLFCAVIFGFCLAARPSWRILNALRRIPKFLLFVLCLAPLVLAWNTETVTWNAATGALEQYAAVREKRDAFMRASPGRDVVVAPLDIRPFPVGPIPIPSLGENRDPVMENPKAWPTKYVARLHGLNSVRNESQRADYAFARMKRLPSHTAIPGVFASYSRNIQTGTNETFRSDWLLVSLPPHEFAKRGRIRVVVISQGSPLAYLDAHRPVFAASVRKPAWVNAALAPRWYSLTNPDWLVTSYVQDRRNKLYCFPVNASGLRAVAAYISLDGETWARVAMPE